MAENDWGGDYSFLIQSIESHISENIPNQALSPNTNNIINYDDNTTTNYKKRKSIDTPSSITSLNINKYSNESASKFRSSIQIDEILLENEQLQDQLKHIKSEFNINKQELIRQIRFLEEQNQINKKESSERLEKYYDEKKKWTIKQRDYELQIKKLTPTNNNVSTTTDKLLTASKSINITSDSNIITQKLKYLENELIKQGNDMKHNINEKIELENKYYLLEQEHKLLQSSIRTYYILLYYYIYMIDYPYTAIYYLVNLCYYI